MEEDTQFIDSQAHFLNAASPGRRTKGARLANKVLDRDCINKSIYQKDLLLAIKLVVRRLHEVVDLMRRSSLTNTMHTDFWHGTVSALNS